MSLINIYEVTFQIHKPTLAVSGPAEFYRRDPRKALVAAADSTEGSIRLILQNDVVTLAAGEVFDILAVHQINFGTEGAAAWQ